MIQKDFGHSRLRQLGIANVRFQIETQRELWEVMKSVFLGGIGVRLMVSEKLMIGYLLHYAGYSVNIR